MDGFDPSSDSDSSCWDECQCSWNWDIPQGDGFAPGKDIGFMTYRDMYEKVTTWHMKVAGETLCVHGRLPRKAKPGEPLISFSSIAVMAETTETKVDASLLSNQRL